MIDVAAGWPLFGALTLLVGVVGARWWVPDGVLRGDDGASRPLGLLRRVGVAACALLVAALLAVFIRQLLEFRDPFAPWTEDARLLLSTRWGGVWTTAWVASVAAGAAFLVSGRWDRWGWGLATALVAGLTVFPALTGHASSGETGGPVMIVLDALHVWAAGCWIGGLLLVLLLDWSASRAGGSSLLPLLVPRFSRVATASVLILLGTGVAASLALVESPGDLITTTYGRTLSLKLVLVAGVLVLGAVNARVWTPRLDADSGTRALRRTAGAELLLGQLVLIVTAILIRTSPGQ